MTSNRRRLYYVGNLDSVLFRQRVAHLKELIGTPAEDVIDTGRRSQGDTIRHLLACTILITRTVLSLTPVRIVLHGAYSPVLWPLLMFRRVSVVSILQGSELNVDYSGLRASIISLILRRSVLVVCRDEAQRKLTVDLCEVLPSRCVIVNWGLDKALFDLPLTPRSGEPVLISPRATQSEYNIPVIFAAVAKLKKDGHRLRFIYVRFNPTFALEDTSAADEILVAPEQSVLWEKMAQADLCVSVPDYDGLSNTVLEALAVGATPLFSDLPTYAPLKKDRRLGIDVALEGGFEQRVERLYSALQFAASHVEDLRSSAAYRRSFAEAQFRRASGVRRIVEAINT